MLQAQGQPQVPPPACVPQTTLRAILTMHCCQGGSGSLIWSPVGQSRRHDTVRSKWSSSLISRLLLMSSQIAAARCWGTQWPLQSRSCAAMGRHDRAALQGHSVEVESGTAAGGPGTAAQLFYCVLQPNTHLPQHLPPAPAAMPAVQCPSSALWALVPGHTPLPSLVLQCPCTWAGPTSPQSCCTPHTALPVP